MKRLILSLLTVGFLNAGFSQVNMAASGTYQQNFNTLANSGTTGSWVNNATIPNWYAQLGSTTTLASYRVDNGSNFIARLRSLGANSSIDRALGSMNGSSSSASNNYAYGVLFQNTSGVSITNLSIAYTLEQWSINNNGSAQPMTVSYRISESPITFPEASVNLGWTQVDDLTSLTPQTGLVTSALDGNASANRVVLNSVSLGSFNLAPGQYLMIRWVDSDAASTDHAIGIDDVSITWSSLTTFYQDADGDGFGNPLATTVSQSPPAGLWPMI
jgi:hypothetical protein